MSIRQRAKDTDFSDILSEEIEGPLKEAAEVSMGTEIAQVDVDNIRQLCEQVVSISEYRASLYEDLRNRMDAVAPNLTCGAKRTAATSPIADSIHQQARSAPQASAPPQAGPGQMPGSRPSARPVSATADCATDTAPAACGRLYRDLLACVFLCLTLRERHVALQASRAWLAAMHAAAPQATEELGRLPQQRLLTSTLAQHLRSLRLHPSTVVLRGELALLRDHMPQLLLLSATVRCYDSDSKLPLPRGVRELSIRPCLYSYSTAHAQCIVDSLPALQALTTLELWLPVDDAVCLAPLLRLPALRTLRFRNGMAQGTLTPTQIALVRQLRPLEAFGFNDGVASSFLAALLQPGYAFTALRSIDMSRATLRDEHLPALMQLPHSITELEPCLLQCGSLAFLSRLPQLAALRLDFCSSPHVPSAENLLSALAHTPLLRRLELRRPDRALSDEHLQRLCARLPVLEQLTLRDLAELRSLSFLSHTPLVSSLRSLELEYCEVLPAAEVRHVLALGKLACFTARSSFGGVYVRNHSAVAALRARGVTVSVQSG